MRQFVSTTEPDKNGLLVLEQKDFRYLRTVLRLRVGDMVRVRTPSAVFDMTLCKIDEPAKRIVLQKCSVGIGGTAGFGAGGGVAMGASHNSEATQDCSFVLFQFIPKPKKMELIVRQATECGVKFIVPIVGEYTQGFTQAALAKGIAKSDRYERIIREARQQSGSPVDTKITEPLSLEGALAFWREQAAGFTPQERAALVVYERTDKTVPLSEAVFGCENGADGAEASTNAEPSGNAPCVGQASPRANIKLCAFAVGSEGGISPAEFETLLGAGFKAVHFKTNILRCETAALYALAAIQSLLTES